MKNKPIILFDGVCNLCNASVRFILKHEKSAYFYFLSLQSDKGQRILQRNNRNTKQLESIILLENNRLYSQSDAILRIAKQLRFPFSLLSLFHIVPKFIRDAIYKFIAKNRYKVFGKSDQCAIPSKENLHRFL